MGKDFCKRFSPEIASWKSFCRAHTPGSCRTHSFNHLSALSGVLMRTVGKVAKFLVPERPKNVSFLEAVLSTWIWWKISFVTRTKIYHCSHGASSVSLLYRTAFRTACLVPNSPLTKKSIDSLDRLRFSFNLLRSFLELFKMSDMYF